MIGVMLMFSPFARAQFSSVLAGALAYDGDDVALVRNMSGSEVITYCKKMFSYENNSTLSYKYFPLPSPNFDSIVVNDFRIINGLLYFCGKNGASNKGVIGVFALADLLGPVGSSVNFAYYELDNTTSLNRMVAYIDPTTNNPRLAAVGQNKNNSCGVWVCSVWVDCPDLLPGATTASVTVYRSYYLGTSDAELWNDVVATDDWVVLVGSGYNSGQQGVVLRRFHKGFPTDPEINKFYIYSESNRLVSEEVRALPIRENDVAVAYRGVRNNNVTDYTKFRIFDIDAMLNINSQEYVVPYKSMLNEMAYMKQADRVVLVNEFPSPQTMSNFVYLIPYQSSYYPSVYVHDGAWRFWSVTDLDGKKFVGAGCFHFLLRDATASFPASNDYSATPSLCPADEALKVSVIDNVNRVVIPDIPPADSILSTSIPVTSTTQDGIMQLKCYSY